MTNLAVGLGPKVSGIPNHLEDSIGPSKRTRTALLRAQAHQLSKRDDESTGGAASYSTPSTPDHIKGFIQLLDNNKTST